MSTNTPSTESFPRITDAGLDDLRQRLGVKISRDPEPWCYEATRDNIRHYAHGIGDDNPLWCDPEYGQATVWGGPIASPNMNGGDTLIGENEVTELDADTKALLKGDPLKGAHAYYSGSHREWWAPLRPARLMPSG